MKVYLYCTLCGEVWNVSNKSKTKDYICPHCSSKIKNNEPIRLKRGKEGDKWLHKIRDKNVV